VLAILTSAVISLFQGIAAQSVHGTQLWIRLFTAVSSLLIALPFIPLFIALSLVANPTEITLDPLEGPAESTQKEST
jgi:ABC-type dipeptide/oligopeptide/nickel transport system permease subunit